MLRFMSSSVNEFKNLNLCRTLHLDMQDTTSVPGTAPYSACPAGLAMKTCARLLCATRSARTIRDKFDAPFVSRKPQIDSVRGEL